LPQTDTMMEESSFVETTKQKSMLTKKFELSTSFASPQNINQRGGKAGQFFSTGDTRASQSRQTLLNQNKTSQKFIGNLNQSPGGSGLKDMTANSSLLNQFPAPVTSFLKKKTLVQHQQERMFPG
jgi:hypothetical protein